MRWPLVCKALGTWCQGCPLPLVVLSPLPMPTLLLRPSLGLEMPSAVLLGWLPVCRLRGEPPALQE